MMSDFGTMQIMMDARDALARVEAPGRGHCGSARALMHSIAAMASSWGRCVGEEVLA